MKNFLFFLSYSTFIIFTSVCKFYLFGIYFELENMKPQSAVTADPKELQNIQ